MKFETPLTIQEIAEFIDAEIIGNTNQPVTGINEIHKVTPGDITFSDVEKYFKKSLESDATIIILPTPAPCPIGKTILVCSEPFEAYNNIVKRFRPFRPLTEKVSSKAQIGEGTVIEPGAIIAPTAIIGRDCYIQATAVIYDHVIIGDRTTIQAGTVIGSDAFYYKREARSYRKWCSGGRVVIGDDVEIGAKCTINKGVSGDTVIGSGTKFDCSIHIGHGAVIGKNCLFAAQVGIGGKTIIGNGVICYGQVGIAQNLTIGDEAVILAQSGVGKDLEGKKVYFGSPATDAREVYREMVAVKKLPFILKDLNLSEKVM